MIRVVGFRKSRFCGSGDLGSGIRKMCFGFRKSRFWGSEGVCFGIQEIKVLGFGRTRIRRELSYVIRGTNSEKSYD